MSGASEQVSVISPPTPSGSVLRTLASDIKISHSVFALPFALLGAFLAHARDSSWTALVIKLILVVACMVCARTYAMLSNRLLDRDIDALNPRTQNRALPSRRVQVRDALVALCWSAGLFVALTVIFGFVFDNWWPLLLSVPVLLWIGSYPWLKRFTWLCHLYLGSSLAISPLAAAIAVRPQSIGQTPAIWLLAMCVMCWVAGFDILYALQDVEVDRRHNLLSIPSRFGVGPALWISRSLHALSALALVVMWIIEPRLGLIFAGGVAIVIMLLVVEHAVTARGTTRRIQLAFFTLNGIISVLLGALGIYSVISASLT